MKEEPKPARLDVVIPPNDKTPEQIAKGLFELEPKEPRRQKRRPASRSATAVPVVPLAAKER